MGLLDKLFGKKSSGGGSGRISLGAINLQQGGGLNAKRCDVCGRTFPCPERSQNVVTLDVNGFTLDIGGYCDRCAGFRCPEHSKWLETATHTWGIGCTECGGRMRGAG
jgi:hypothetical protein